MDRFKTHHLSLLRSLRGLLLIVLLFAATSAWSASDFPAVQAIFDRHCVECHAGADAEGKLVMDTFSALMKGGENGAAVVPGDAQESLMVRFIEGRSGKTGKNQFMPPGKKDRLTPVEIALVRKWIADGAKGPETEIARSQSLVVPRIQPRKEPVRSIKAVAAVPGGKHLAIACLGDVEIRSAETGALVKTFSGHRGPVNALVVSADGSFIFAAAGQAGLFGEVRQWNLSTGEMVRLFEGHTDALYAVALSPDGKILASGGYDQRILLRDASTGGILKELRGHNGCVYDLAFRRDGKILASASADRTVKLWDVASGERRDTFSQPTKEVYTVAFSPDGKHLAAAGVDNRIRVWSISEKAVETSNPMLYSRFGHEGAILRIAYSKDGKSLVSGADDRTVKFWNAGEMKERMVLERQPDWAPALCFDASGSRAFAGRLDGSLISYDVSSGAAIALKEFYPGAPRLASGDTRQSRP